MDTLINHQQLVYQPRSKNQIFIKNIIKLTWLMKPNIFNNFYQKFLKHQ